MSGLCIFQRKKKQTPAEDNVAEESKQHFSSHRSTNAAPAVSTKSDEKNKKRRIHLFGYIQKKETNSTTKEDVGRIESDPTLTAKSTEPNQTAKKTGWWKRLFKCCKRKKRVTLVPATAEEQEDPQRSRLETPEGMNEKEEWSPFSHQDEVVPVLAELEESRSLFDKQPDMIEDDLSLPELPDNDTSTEQAIIEALPEDELNSSRPETPKGTNEQEEWSSFSPQDEVVPALSELEELFPLFDEQPYIPEDDFSFADYDKMMEQTIIEALIKEELNSTTRSPSPNSPKVTNKQNESSSFTHQDEPVPVVAELEESWPLFGEQPDITEDKLLLPEYHILTEQTIIEALIKEELNSTTRSPSPNSPKVTNKQNESSSFTHQDELVPVVAELEELWPLFGEQPDITEDKLLLPNYHILTEQTIIEALIKEELNSTTRSPVASSDVVKESITTPPQSVPSSSSRPGTPAELEESCSLFGGQPDITEDTSSLPRYKTPAEQTVNKSMIKITKCHVDFSDRVKWCTPTNPLGFPNIGQSCYMNSSLQSLLMLENFIGDISCQEQVWSSIPEAQLMRSFMMIREAHASTDPNSKRHLLRSFKKAVSVQAPEFSNSEQKDAHEFLTSVLAQMWSLSPLLQDIAACTDTTYTCPVENHMMFKIENTRTCKRCGAQSKNQEVFTNLSLDLVPQGSVENMLQEYLMETELECKCECGGKTMGQRSAFETLPNVLVLHLKRFRTSSSFKMVKVHDPVLLHRDMVVSSKEDAGCYSLVSAISHLGYSGEAGHYICDGVHPDDSPTEPSDRWITFNDSKVTETTGKAVCEARKESAYILFYKRQE